MADMYKHASTEPRREAPELFSVLASTMDAEAEQKAGTRARIALKSRVANLLPFLKQAETTEELESRLNLVSDKIDATVAEVAEEHGYADTDSLKEEVVAHLRTAMPGAQNSGDNYQGEQVKVQGEEGPVPKIDTKQIPEDGLPAIDVGSVRHPSEMQSVKDRPSPEDLDKPDHAVNEAVTQRVEADKPIDSEETGEGGAWSGQGGQANPVTSAVESKWDVLDN